MPYPAKCIFLRKSLLIFFDQIIFNVFLLTFFYKKAQACHWMGDKPELVVTQFSAQYMHHQVSAS